MNNDWDSVMFDNIGEKIQKIAKTLVYINVYNDENYIDSICPHCGESVSFLKNQTNVICPWCDTKINNE